jgi:hypothetical protein
VATRKKKKKKKKKKNRQQKKKKKQQYDRIVQVNQILTMQSRIATNKTEKYRQQFIRTFEACVDLVRLAQKKKKKTRQQQFSTPRQR